MSTPATNATYADTPIVLEFNSETVDTTAGNFVLATEHFFMRRPRSVLSFVREQGLSDQFLTCVKESDEMHYPKALVIEGGGIRVNWHPKLTP